MSSLTPEAKVVRLQKIYLAAREIFSSPHNNASDFFSIAAVISAHEWTFSTLLVAYGRETVFNIVKSLLDRKAFTSGSTLQELYPGVYQGVSATTMPTGPADHYAYDPGPIAPKVSSRAEESAPQAGHSNVRDQEFTGSISLAVMR